MVCFTLCGKTLYLTESVSLGVYLSACEDWLWSSRLAISRYYFIKLFVPTKQTKAL